MPQLVKGGKHVFGWSFVREEGRFILPPEACLEYNYEAQNKVIILSGSKTSGGFSIIKIAEIVKSSLSNILTEFPDLMENDFHREQIIKSGTRKICWTLIEEGCLVKLSDKILREFNVSIGSKILAVRGSGLGLGFITKGPIYQLALTHEKLDVF